MSATLRDLVPPLLTVVILSPLAILGFRNGVPIEVIVFGLLLAGYKGGHFFSSWKRKGDNTDGQPRPGENDGNEDIKDEDIDASPNDTTDAKTPAEGSKTSWRMPWKSGGRRGADSKGSNEDSATSEQPSILSWRSRPSGETKLRSRAAPQRAEAKPKPEPKSGLAMLKKTATQTQWRSIINKFTPEKFDKLCEQLLATLPAPGETTPSTSSDGAGRSTCSDEEFEKVLQELLSLIFDACSRQHQYTEMYTNLCQKLLDFVSKERPDLDCRACVWGKCQHIFHNNVLKAPEIPADLPEDEYMDRKAKLKEKNGWYGKAGR